MATNGQTTKSPPNPSPLRSAKFFQANMRILITGGAGFIGSHLVDRLMQNEKNEVIVVDNYFTGSKDNLKQWIGHPRFELIRHDVTEPLFLEVDQIYHLACPASPIFYKHNPVKTIKTNVMGTLNMLGLAKRVGARILLTSTSEVYGDPLEHPQTESYWGNVNPIGVRSCYDEGKRVAETLMFDYHRQHGIEIRIARIFNTYGPRMNIDDGRVVSNFIAQAIREEPLTVQLPGTQTRSFCYVSDMVDGLVRLMDGEHTGPVNIGNPGEFTMLELAEIVKEVHRNLMEPDLRDPEEKMASFSPWKRGRPESWGPCKIVRHSFWEKFDSRVYANMDLDIDTKRAALKASPFVVSLVSLAGGEPLFKGSGTIVDCEAANGAYSITILASARPLGSSAGLDVDNDIKIEVHLSDGTLLNGQVDACDFHYNLALIKIQHEVMVQPASLRILDDSISTHPCGIEDKGVGSESFQLRPHSDLIRLCPGDVVVALGRYFEEPYEVMAAPGRFSLDSVEFDCKELFRANCKISKCGIGGPLINRYGDVIGVNFYDELCTPFLPINIVLKWLEHFKKYGRFFRPCLGMQMTNLCAARPGQLEKIIQKFPNMSEGVLVEKVIEGSPAECAGILHGDVIVQCAGKFVRSFLEFCGVVWDKAGKSVKVVVIRKTSGARLKIKVKVVDEINPGNFYRWPLPEKRWVSVNRVRR